MGVIVEIANYKENGCMPMNEILKKLENKSPTQLLRENDISLNPPIDLKKLLKKLGISVYGVDFSEMESELGYDNGEILGATYVPDDKRVVIFYRKYKESHSVNRERFTTAHELAHCVLDVDSLNSNHIELRSENNGCCRCYRGIKPEISN